MEIVDEEHGHAGDVLKQDDRDRKDAGQEEDQPRIAVAPRGMGEGRDSGLDLLSVGLVAVVRERGGREDRPRRQ